MQDEHRSEEQAQADENAGQVAERLEGQEAPEPQESTTEEAARGAAEGAAQGAAAREDVKVPRQGDVK